MRSLLNIIVRPILMAGMYFTACVSDALAN